MYRPMKEVAIIGLGYVGLPLALLVDKHGYKASGIDTDAAKVKSLADRAKRTKLKFGTTFESVKTADIVVICVPTPVKNDSQPDLEPLKSAVTSVAKNLKKGALVIIESTV